MSLNEQQSDINNVRKWEEFLHNDARLQATITATFENIGLHKDFLRTEEMSKYPKFIKDSLWGNISLPPDILSIVDSPFFQKQRHVSKLGLTSLTYPGASHSLLEHSLGGYFLLEKFFASSKENLSITKEQQEQIKIENIIFKHAVLLFGFGQPPYGDFCSSILLNSNHALYKNLHFAHCNLSHLIDNAKRILGIKKSIWMTDAFFNYKIISSIFILSKSFSEYYNRLWCFREIYSNKQHPTPSVLLSACMLGYPINDNPHLFNDLFHGPFGVKNIEALVRDTKNCGINSPLDYERILATARLTYAYSNDIEGTKQYNQNVRRILFVDKLDPFIFREIEMSHELLRLRITSHPWRVAFQNLLQVMLSTKLKNNEAVYSNNNLDYLKIWSLFEGELLKVYSASQNEIAARIGKKLMYRQVPHRCFAISIDTLANVWTAAIFKPNDKIIDLFNALIKRLFDKICNRLSDSEYKNVFVEKIKTEVNRISTILNKAVNILDFEIYSVLTTEDSEQNFSSEGFISQKHRKILRRNLLSEETRKNNRNVLFFYSNYEFKLLSHIALKKILFEEFVIESREIIPLLKKSRINFGAYEIKKMRFLLRPYFDYESLVTLCGLKREDVDRLETDLADKGYYDDLPILYENNKFAGRIEEICLKFKNYQGEGEYTITDQSVKYFIQQFPPRLRNEITHLVEKIEILGRNSLTNNVVSTMKSLKKRVATLYTCPFTQSSGLRIKTNMGKNSMSGIVNCSDVYEVLTKINNNENATILFYDDNLISGNQAEEQLCTWLGLSHNKNESNVFKQQLQPEEIAKLKEANLHFSFYIAWEKGVSKLASFLQEKDFRFSKNNIHYKCHIDEHSGQKECSDELRMYLKNVGSTIYKNKLLHENSQKFQDADFIYNRSLGFDNLEGLFITDCNVPTATYTALWCPGVVNNGVSIPWKPLFIRNNSFAHYVW